MARSRDPVIVFNQSMIISVIRKLYGVSDPSMSPARNQSSTPSDDSYANYYRRMKEMAKDKGWKEE